MKALYLSVLVVMLGFPWLGISQSSLADAEVLFYAKNYSEAIDVLKQYLYANRQDKNALELLGDSYSYNQEWEYAASQYRTLLNLNPDEADYCYKYGGALAMRALAVNKLTAISMIIEAKDYFLKAANLDVNHIEVRWALVKTYMELPFILGGSKTNALQFAEELAKLSKVDGYLAKGYIFETTEEFELAEANYLEALNVGGSKTCYNMLSNCYLIQGKNKEALSVLKEGYLKWNDSELLQKIKEISL